jgi:hypothetical protein
LTNFYEDTSDSYAVNSSLIDNANARGVYASAISHPATLFLILERDTSKKPHGTTVSRNNIKIDKVGYYGHPGGGDTVAFVDGHIESLPATHPGMEGSNGTSSTAWTNYWLP